MRDLLTEEALVKDFWSAQGGGRLVSDGDVTRGDLEAAIWAGVGGRVRGVGG